MYLAELEGEWCFLHLLRMQSRMRINSWILVDITNKHSGKRYQINFDDFVKYYPHVLSRETVMDFYMSILGIYNDELLLHWNCSATTCDNILLGSLK